ncbi:MAG: 30S ribosomal protein S6e [Candidatus Thermoplasmatota archaeon]
MVEFRAVISDPRAGRCYNRVIAGNHANSLIGRKIRDRIDGIFAGMPGYKLEITGGSDKDGFPMRPDLPGPRRTKLLVAGGVGFHPRRKGERRRKTFRGNTISLDVVQLNLKIVQYGPGNVEELLGTEKEAEKK